MSKITNRVLTAKNQGLPAGKQKNARENIGVSVKNVSVDGNVVSFDTDSGEKTYTGGLVSDVTISDREEYKSVSVVHKDGDSVTVDIYDKAQVDELLANFGGFEKVDGTGEDCHPDVNDPNPRVIYLVEVPGTPEPDHCKEWIWDVSKESWECIGDTTMDVPAYVDVTGTVSDTTLAVNLEHNRYARIAVGSTITDLVVNVPADPDKVGWFRFEFTLPEDTDLKRVSVLDATGSECLMFAPMSWPGLVTYQGEVTDRIAKIIGFSPVLPEENVLCTENGTNIVTGDRKKLRYRIVED